MAEYQLERGYGNQGGRYRVADAQLYFNLCIMSCCVTFNEWMIL